MLLRVGWVELSPYYNVRWKNCVELYSNSRNDSLFATVQTYKSNENQWSSSICSPNKLYVIVIAMVFQVGVSSAV